ncbi:Transcription factor with zinc finger DNA-binding motif, putative [Candida maltosa Xu316]|uniref:Transcription factor with zinc finger DNA-binding motif, putative n=1 Tax=Candida maltosa (strain Xu316) TaxID=1245528 RepID=M3IUH6_CANMX|nr:Transcription factor with zinc finger DNA-binding motif, putative [Candida maltosa Xu316]
MEFKPKRTRSRGGCSSCKGLKIKCDESKPSCSYCISTRRTCFYPILKPLKKDIKAAKQKETSPPIIEVYGNKDTSTHVDELTRELVLTQSTTILGISKFELRLLRFFDQGCLHLFSFGVNDTVHNTWKYKVPYLFMESELVRKSIFSLSAMALLTAIDLDMIQGVDASQDEKSLMNIYNLNLEDKHSIFSKNIEYFAQVIDLKKRMIGVSSNEPDFQDPKVAKELMVASILIFVYLGVHPHRLIPLIDFTKETTDFVQITKGIRSTVVNCLPTLAKTDLRGIVEYGMPSVSEIPTFKQCTYPVIVDLKQGLEKLNEDEISSTNTEVISALTDAIYSLIVALYRCNISKHPIPIYRYLLSITDDFRDLLYKKHPYALRILFVYACLSLVSKFSFYGDKNLLRDYVLWYKDYLENFSYEMDHYFFELVVNKRFTSVEFGIIHEFDPKIEYQKLA